MREKGTLIFEPGGYIKWIIFNKYIKKSPKRKQRGFRLVKRFIFRCYLIDIAFASVILIELLTALVFIK
jgi:hypothetical protein